MKCFYSGVEAIGICLSCGRGLSREFASELPQGLACKNRCEEKLNGEISLNELDLKLTAVADSLARAQSSTTIVSGCFCILAGGAFVYFDGFYGGLSLTNFMGGAFCAYGIFTLIRAFIKRRNAVPASKYHP